MAKGDKNFNTCTVHLGQQDMTSLLTVLTYFIEADDTVDKIMGKYAKNIRDKILMYRRQYTRKGEKNYVMLFSETEAALLIKFFAMFASSFLSDDVVPDTSSV